MMTRDRRSDSARCPTAVRSGVPSMLIYDASGAEFESALGTRWQGISDRVMGGVSRVTLQTDTWAGRRCLRLSGDVRLDNNGGFVQMALDLQRDGGTVDATRYAGVRLVVWGNGHRYGLHIRTADVVRPWQSYRTAFHAPPQWSELRLPFARFLPHRIDGPLDLSRLRRLGLVAIGEAFFADLRLAELGFYV